MYKLKSKVLKFLFFILMEPKHELTSSLLISANI